MCEKGDTLQSFYYFSFSVRHSSRARYSFPFDVLLLTLLPLVFMLFITFVVDIYLCILSCVSFLEWYFELYNIYTTIQTNPWAWRQEYDNWTRGRWKTLSFFFPWTFCHFVFFFCLFMVVFYTHFQWMYTWNETKYDKKKRRNEQTFLGESVCRRCLMENEETVEMEIYVWAHFMCYHIGVIQMKNAPNGCCVFFSLSRLVSLVVIIFELYAASYYIIFGI